MFARFMPYAKIGAAIGLALLSGFMWYQAKCIDKLRVENTTLEDSLKKAKESLEKVEKQLEGEKKARLAVEADNQTIRSRLTAPRLEIQNAKKDKDGPVAPVLHDALNILRPED